jgi:cyclopropane-fatty-acyl-phospholipid synthase
VCAICPTPGTLDTWASALEAHKDEAIAIQFEEVYERYIDVNQFTLTR